MQVLHDSMDLCGGDVTLTASSYRHRDGRHELFVAEYLRGDVTELRYLLTWA